MFGGPDGTYAAGMERSPSVTNRLTLAPESDSRRSIVRTCGSFTLMCLKAIAESYVLSCSFNPYWIGAGPLTESHRDEERQR